MKTFFKFIGFTLLAIICGGSLYLAIEDPIFPVVIEESKAQSIVQEQMPFSKTVDVKIPLLKDRQADIIVKTIELDFLESGNIQIDALLSIDIDGRSVEGSVDAEGQVVYRGGEFFLHNVNINKYHLDEYEITEKDQNLLTKGKDMVEKGKKHYSRLKGLFKKAEDEGDLTPEITEKSISKIKAMGDKIKVDLMAKTKTFIINKVETTPLYKLNGDDYKQNIAKLMLRDIEVNDNEFTVNMSGGKLVSTIWLYIISFFAALAFIVAIFKSANNRKGGSGGGGILAEVGEISLDISLDL